MADFDREAYASLNTQAVAPLTPGKARRLTGGAPLWMTRLPDQNPAISLGKVERWLFISAVAALVACISAPADTAKVTTVPVSCWFLMRIPNLR
jgi:hypothetical protein